MKTKTTNCYTSRCILPSPQRGRSKKRASPSQFSQQLISLVLLSLLTACSLAPKYHRPLMPIPLHYKENDPWKPAKSTSLEGKANSWWRMFEDPILNKLQEKLACSNQNLKIALARYQQSRAALQVAQADYYPQALGIGNAVRQKSSENTANVLRNTLFNDFLLGSIFTYEVDLWGRVRNSVAASRNNAQASAADLAAVALSLHAQLAMAYFNFRGVEASQRVLDETVAAYQKALYLTRKRYQGGASPIANVDEAITQVENAKTLATDMRLKQAQLEHAIAILVGEIPSSFTMPSAKTAIKPIKIAAELPSTLLERRPDIAAAQLRVQAANAEIGVACAAFFPSLNLISFLAFGSQSLGNLFSKPSLIWSLGPPTVLALVQPMAQLVIFDGGRLTGLLNNAKASYFETVASYRQTVLSAFQEVEDSLVAIRRLDEELRSQTAATTAAKRALMQANYRYQGGLTTYLNVVVSENLALQAELASINVRTRRQISSVQLIKALGGGWPCSVCE